MSKYFHSSSLDHENPKSPLTTGYTENNPPDQIKSGLVGVNSNQIRTNSAQGVKNFHSVTLWGFWGLGWTSGGKLAGENCGFDIGAPKLFNNSTTFQF
jgi:hypothetical protein